MKYLLSISALIFTVSFVSIPLVWSDGNLRWGEHEEHEEYERRSMGVAVADNPLYREECGTCHMAYPAGLMPAVSWEKVMQGLDDHFGDNAELDDESKQQITVFLQQNSSDKAYYRRSKQFTDTGSLKNVRTRITDSTYFRHEHDEIPDRLVTGNPEVKSFSHCNACHLKAAQGMFSEHDIKIPGFGRWDD